jgi:prepilin-type N-terminal cleavage/methylation domain-containing protein
MKTNGFQPIARYFKYQRGFTLLEMVLVLLIMGMVASLSVVFIDNEDNQLRYEESMHKLTILHDAVITERRYQDQVLLSGFVVDNGVLPPDMESLIIRKPTGWELPASLPPVEYRILDSHSPYTPLPGFILNKGYRERSIRSGIDSQDDFKDGWGDGFGFSLTANDLDLKYLGAGKVAPFNTTDIKRDVKERDWSIALSEVNILIKNKTFDASPSVSAFVPVNNVFIALVVFKNSQTDPTDPIKTNNSVWKTYHFKLALIAADSSRNSDGASWKNEADEDATASRIPAGEHIVFVGVDGATFDGKIERNDINNDGDYDDVDIGEFDEIKDQAILKVIPRFTQPSVTLVIKD